MESAVITQESALSAQAQNNVGELPYILVAVALHEADLEWAQSYCLSLAAHPNENVRGNAILGFGHLARRFGQLTAEAKPIIEAALTDSSAFVRGQAVASADDVGQFLGWQLPNNSFKGTPNGAP
jgi:hypothetical protein